MDWDGHDKARVLAAALNGRVIGAADAEICRVAHPAEACHEGDIAIAFSARYDPGPGGRLVARLAEGKPGDGL